jgi:Right handed beta helix region
MPFEPTAALSTQSDCFLRPISRRALAPVLEPQCPGTGADALRLMSPRHCPGRGLSRLSLLIMTFLFCCVAAGCGTADTDDAGETTAIAGPVYVAPGEDLQESLDRAARATHDRRLVIKSGVYSSNREQFCLLAITRRHDGVTVVGEGDVVLSARKTDSPDHAAVSHIIYCGDGVGPQTKIQNVTLSGALGRVTESGAPIEEYGSRAKVLQRGLFFQFDGGALKVFGDSAAVFRNVDFFDNETDLCGGAVSIEQQGVSTRPVVFQNCRFSGNRSPATGSAVDVLQGSKVELQNCLFTNNIANYGMDRIKQTFRLEYNPEHGCGALTVFPGSVATVSHCTFSGNWNAIDDHGTGSRYEHCIFDRNNASNGSRPGAAYEMDIVDGSRVTGCVFNSNNPDLRNTISGELNNLDVGDPLFDDQFVPGNPDCRSAGYRPQD